MTDIAPGLPAEARQFDFWLGDWDCTWGEDQRAVNHVSALYGGRVIHEQFDGAPAQAFQGQSLSVYNAVRRVWQQTWVDDSGNYWAFEGRFVDGEMNLSTADVLPDQRPVLRRMVWYNITPSNFDWRWEKSEDDGLTWAVLWQLRYTRRTLSPPA